MIINLIKLLCLFLSFSSSIVLTNELIEIVKKEDLVRIKELLEQGYDVNCQDEEGNTALIIAFEFKNQELVKLLLEFEANVNIENNKGKSALKQARRMVFETKDYWSVAHMLQLEGCILENESLSHINKLNIEYLLWFLNRVIDKNKESLLDLEWQSFIQIYKKINLKTDSNIELINVLNEIKETINSLLAIGKKNKYSEYRKYRYTESNPILAYKKLASDIAEKLDLNKSDDLTYKDTFKSIKNKILEFNNFINDETNYYFEEAIKKGYYDKVNNFIKEGADVNKWQSGKWDGWIPYNNPLTWALKKDCIDIVKLLLIFDADPDSIYYDECYDYGSAEPCWVNEFHVYSHAKDEKSKKLLEAASLIRKNKIEDGIKVLVDNNLNDFIVAMMLLAAKKHGLSSLKKIDFIKDNYKEELNLLDGFTVDREKLKELVRNYSHKEVEFQDRIRIMAYISYILSGSRFNVNASIGTKLSNLLSLPCEVATKIASYV